MEGDKAPGIGDGIAGAARAERGGGEEPLLGVKLRKGLSAGRRGGPCTPVPSWKMDVGGPSSSSLAGKGNPSARKLGASLWEAQELLARAPAGRHRSGARRRQLGDPHSDDDASEPGSPPPRPKGTTRFMRGLGTPFEPKDKLTEGAVDDWKPESPASYNSSVEQVPSLKQAVTPSSSLDLIGRLGGSGYGIKTSAELLKVLNRIWKLEEQLESNVSLVKTLKAELRHAHSRIQDLMQEQQAYRHEMDGLMKRLSEDREARKNKERDRIMAAVQSIKNELEDEMKLRRQSESLHRKLGKELSGVKLAFEETLNNLESERKARGLLEDLCDEFAKGFLEYGQTIRNLDHKFGKDANYKFDQPLHHISKIWMDERMQMKVAHGEVEKSKILERLAAQVMTFFYARTSSSSRKDGTYATDEKGNSSLRRRSLESVHLNGATSAPRDAEDDDSVVSDLHCFELNMDATDNKSYWKKNGGCMETLEGKSRGSFKNEKSKFPEMVGGSDACCIEHDRTGLCNGKNMHHINSPIGHQAIGSEGYKGYSYNSRPDSNHFSMSSLVNASGSGDSHNQTTFSSQLNNNHLAFSDMETSKCPSIFQQPVKENSLKEKLIEARIEGKNARLRALKGFVEGLQ